MKKTILVIAAGPFHPPLVAVWRLRKQVRNWTKEQGYKVQFALHMEALTRRDLSKTDALVLYFHHNRLSDRALDVFARFVKAGGGVLAVHSPTASFKKAPSRYFEILGGKFAGHGPIETITLTPNHESRVFEGIGGFSVRDELYVHDLQPGLTPHFTAVHEGETVPLVWTQTYGAGRMCYAGPGHTAASIKHPVYEQVLRRGLAWVVRR